MIGFTRAFTACVCAVTLAGGIAAEPVIVKKLAPVTDVVIEKPVVEEDTTVEVTEEAPAETTEETSILDDYLAGVDSDTNAFVEEIGGIIDAFAKDAVEIVEEMLTDPEVSPEDMADKMEERAEEFADSLEQSGEAFGELQEIAGEIFGEKFDKDTAKSVISVIRGFFGRR